MSQLGPCENCIPLLQLSEYCTSEFIGLIGFCAISFTRNWEQKQHLVLKTHHILPVWSVWRSPHSIINAWKEADDIIACWGADVTNENRKWWLLSSSLSYHARWRLCPWRSPSLLPPDKCKKEALGEKRKEGQRHNHLSCCGFSPWCNFEYKNQQRHFGLEQQKQLCRMFWIFWNGFTKNVLTLMLC